MPKTPKRIDRTVDLQGNAYAKIRNTKEGCYVRTDGDFTCMPKNARRKVFKDDKGNLYIRCNEGYHGLDGQVEGSVYIGLYPSK